MKEAVTIKGMHVGAGELREEEELAFCKQVGVEYVHATPPVRPSARGLGPEKGYWEVDSLTRFREYVESFGLTLVMVSLPRASIVEMGERRGSSIMLGAPERDRDIERICKNIEAAGKAGIPVLAWGFSALGVVRTPGWFIGRGGSKYFHFDYDKMKNESPHPAGPISAEQAWERIEYVIKHVIPVAEEYNVRMACHPDDVAVPQGMPYRGIVPVLNNVDGLKRYIDLSPSPYHGLTFCQGCVSEFSTEPEQVYEAIRYFGSRQKIFWVHFRNIRGGPLKYQETSPDEGKIDMVKAMRVYKEVGYNGVFIPDHVPLLEIDTVWNVRARANVYALGYIKALIQAVESEN